MSRERFSRLKEILVGAIALPPGEREAFLSSACAGDEALREEAAALLEFDPGPPGAGAAPAAVGERAAALPKPHPSTVGPYTLLGILGEGGMGIVYHARQDEPIRREVAVKLVHGGHDSAAIRARFEMERQTLSLMDHPAIARVLDAGATESGDPYFVMELVRGVPITTYCRERGLRLRERLRLFAEVCRAVRHAHWRGVIHRDLKPSNVLVTDVEGEAGVKVIDFGIAKILERTTRAQPYQTRTGQIVGTLEYMSPEQARGEVSAIDVRSDVFSLGVILYELLTDTLPHDLRGQPLHEAVRRICEDPPLPLKRAGAITAERVDLDLQTIIWKCLEKDPNRRYGGAAELAEDFDRYLSDRPILARPQSARYRALKFASRHKLGVSVGATGFAALLVFSVTLTVLLQRATRERDRANLQTEAASRVAQFLVEIFAVSDPSEARGSTVSAREILDRGAARVAREMDGQPEIRARLMAAIGAVYKNLGLFRSAAPLLEDSLRIRRDVLGEGHPETIASMLQLGDLLQASGRLEEAEALLGETLEISRRVLGDGHPDSVAALSDLAVVTFLAGRLEEAEALCREALGKRRRLLGSDHPATLETLNNFAALLVAQGRVAEAEPLGREALEGRRRGLGADHPATLDSLINLGTILLLLGRAEQAEPLLREAVELGRRLRPDHPKTFGSINNLANLLQTRGRLDEAEPLYHEALGAYRASLGEDATETILALGNLGNLHTEQGRHAEAEALLSRAVEAVRRNLPQEHVVTGLTLRKWGHLLAVIGRHREAESALIEAERALAASVGPDHAQTRTAVQDLIDLYEAAGRTEDAAAWQARLAPG